jgi:hypothetical protein
MPRQQPVTPRESTAAMVRNIALELAEIQAAIGRCRGDRLAEPKLTGTWKSHLLICGRALLNNLLIDTARRPQRINGPTGGGVSSADRARPLRRPRAGSKG